GATLVIFGRHRKPFDVETPRISTAPLALGTIARALTRATAGTHFKVRLTSSPSVDRLANDTDGPADRFIHPDILLKHYDLRRRRTVDGPRHRAYLGLPVPALWARIWGGIEMFGRSSLHRSSAAARSARIGAATVT